MESVEAVAYTGTEFGSGTTAIEVSDYYWIGTTRSDRIATLPKAR